MSNLIYNAIKCPDGTILVSKHRHDFQRHIQSDGREYFVDGGLAYRRIGGEDYEDLAVYDTDVHSKIREVFEWTRRLDANMNRLDKPEQVLLKDISDEHLKNLVEWTKEDYPDYIHNIFLDEMCWRDL